MSFLSGLRVVAPVIASASLLAAGSAVPLVPTVAPDRAGQASNSHPWLTLPKAGEHRYRIKGRIRLLLFWVGKDNVGSARVAWYRGSGTDRGYEVLIGSDPTRAPRKVNRWGYIAEEHVGATTTMFGVMKPSDEATLAEAEAKEDRQSEGGAVFSMLHETVARGESVSKVTTARLSRDYTFRDLDPILAEFAALDKAPAVKRAPVDAGVIPGLLTTIVTAIHDDAEARRAGQHARGVRGKVWRYAFNTKVYNLTLASSEYLGSQERGGRRYEKLVQNEFEISMSGFTWTERFTMVYAMDDPDIELPVFIVYQPRWWFKAELQLDDSQVI